MGCDPEFLSRIFVRFCGDKFIQIKYIRTGKTLQNVNIEGFNKNIGKVCPR